MEESLIERLKRQSGFGSTQQEKDIEDIIQRLEKLEALEAENKTLREALEFYADESNWFDEKYAGDMRGYSSVPILSNGNRDRGWTARKALKGGG